MSNEESLGLVVKSAQIATLLWTPITTYKNEFSDETKSLSQ